ncbi:helix-turn-helix transcriptional regulator [Roseovarius aquimarinus]|uniref:Helix-turn-helix transcriptional regulator n=1 Tax=Roseovarius aquimarinus TaxID=1229156 RepID=A0ABW7I699_9RHOB
MIQKLDMQSILFPTGFKPEQSSLYELSNDSGLNWETVRTVLRGGGSISSLNRLRAALGLRWSWTNEIDGVAAAQALAARRKAKLLSQRDMAAKLGVSPQTIVTLETRFRARVETLRRYLRALGFMNMLAAPSNRLVPKPNHAEADLVFTPRNLAVHIVKAFADEIGGAVLEPARGDRAFYDALPAHVTKHWCEISEGRDFFDFTTPVDWIITNPPWSRFRDFLEHSLRVADNVLFLAPVNHFGTKRRVSLVRDAGFGLKRTLFVPSPTAWPSSGFQLAAVHLQRGWSGAAEIMHHD